MLLFHWLTKEYFILTSVQILGNGHIYSFPVYQSVLNLLLLRLSRLGRKLTFFSRLCLTLYYDFSAEINYEIRMALYDCARFVQERRGAYAIILPKQNPTSLHLSIPIKLELFSSTQTAIIDRVIGKIRINCTLTSLTRRLHMK